MTNDHHDEHGNGNSHGHVPFYSRPSQRQKWGDHQIHPHANWGDTFFDLFYVAAAYNLGNLIRSEPTSRGVLYFLGCFYPIYLVWQHKMYYDARFYVLDDVFHKFYEFAILVLLATAVLHIRPVSILSNPSDNIDMFTYCLAATLANVLSCLRFLEVVLYVDGQPAAKMAGRRDLKYNVLTLSVYTAATVVSGIEYFSASGDDKLDDDHHRMIAEVAATSSGNENDIPIWLSLIGTLTSILGLGIMVLRLPGGGKHKEILVPMNINFGIHRYGEWTMLMLGETVLSLLIVDVSESSDYYKTFFSGIISITLLEFLHFRSQPHDPDDHALRQSKESGVIFTILMQIYSAALVALGTAYKMLLYEYVFEESTQGSHRKLLSAFLERFLAGSEPPTRFSTDDRRQRVANFFCASMAIVWICLDGMILAHKGVKKNVGRCKCEHTGAVRYYAVALFIARVGLIAFIASLSQYVTDPDLLAFIGLLGICAQVLLRMAGTSLFGEDFHQEENEFESSAFWPNKTTPQALPAEHTTPGKDVH